MAHNTAAESIGNEKKRTISSKTSMRTARLTRIQKFTGISGVVDLPFLIIILVLLVFGIVMMFSASYVWALHDIDETGGDGAYYMKRQAIWAIGGLGLMAFLSGVDYHILKKKIIAIGLPIVSWIMLWLVFTPLGVTRNGARRWLNLGFVQFQPSELMKLGIIVLFSFLIANNYKKMNKISYGIIFFGILLVLALIPVILQPHLSATILICAIAFAMIFVGGAKFSHIALLITIGVALISIVILSMVQSGDFTYITKRIDSWLDPFSDMLNSTWQTCQSLIAIGSGGIFGLGLGNSRQKYLYLPETQNDFVFAIVCEELGFVGAMAVIILFVLFVFRGFYIASKACDKFGMMLATGLTVQIGIQAFLNIAVVTNAVPNTGISLPFFSYGGTALLMQLAQMGIMLNISRQSLIEN